MSELSERVQSVLGDAYHIERELPPGGMSRLFLATERSLDRQVVVKILPPELASEVSAARFQREVTLAAHLQHPHILPVLSAGSRDGILYYITPYVDGESLRQLLDREPKLPVNTAVRILTEAAGALARAHAAGVIHRDIKPENILLQDGHALLADFGVARALHEATGTNRLTDVGIGIGTPGYMAPEQIAGERNVDARADVYALAVVGYEMLAGKPPFTGATPQATAALQFTRTATPLIQLRPEVPRPVSDAITKALAKDPDSRIASATEFRDLLTIGAPSSAPRPTRTIAIVLAAVLVVAITGLALWRTRSHTTVPLDDNLIAVEPFTVLDPSLDVWREGMVDVLAQNFDGAGPLRTVSPTLIVHRGRDGTATPADFARQLGAGLAITGRIERSGTDSVRVSAGFVDVHTGRPGEVMDYRGRTDHMDVVTDSLTVALLRSLARTHTVGVARGSLAGAKSLSALKALLESEQAYRRGQWDSAQKAAQEAIRLDSTFALAYYWYGYAAAWANGYDSLTLTSAQLAQAHNYAQLAQAHNHGLSPRDSLLIAANVNDYRYSTYHEQAQLFALADAGVQRYPDDPLIWGNLGEVREHVGLGQHVGVPARAILDAFAHTIALDSNFAPAYVHAISRSLQVSGADSGLRYARRFLALNPPPVDADATRLVILLLGHPRDTLAARHLIDSTSLEALGRAYVNLHYVPDSAESDVWLADAMVRRFGPAAGALGNPAYAHLAIALGDRGHLRAMRQAVRSWGVHVPPQPTASLAIAGSLRIFSAAVLDSVLRIPSNMHGGWSWLGLRWWAERGDTADIHAFLTARTTNVPFEPNAEPHPATYDTAVARAYLYLAQHDTAAAMRRFAALPDTLCLGLCELDTVTWGDLLTTHGRAAEADSLLQREAVTPFWDFGDLLRTLALARAADRAGDRTTAIDAYSRIEDFWIHADPELQPVVKEARAALARLSSDTR
jgi:hypothetical protein